MLKRQEISMNSFNSRIFPRHILEISNGLALISQPIRNEL